MVRVKKKGECDACQFYLVRTRSAAVIGHSGLYARQRDRWQEGVRESMCVLSLNGAWQAGVRSVTRRYHGPAIGHAARIQLYASDGERPPDLGPKDPR